MELSNNDDQNIDGMCCLECHFEGSYKIGGLRYLPRWKVNLEDDSMRRRMIDLGIEHGRSIYDSTQILPSRIQVLRRNNDFTIVVYD